MEERSYEMLWDCAYCDTRKLLAKSQRFCPKCGAPQDPAGRYFPADEDKVEVTGYKYVGADKICPACQTPNGALAEFCGQCGSPLDKAAAVQRAGEQVRAEGETFGTGISLRGLEENLRRQRQAAVADQTPSKGRLRVWPIALIVGLVLVLIALFTWTREETVEVTGHRWRQEIQIERFGPSLESAWCGMLPPGAYGVTSRTEIRSYRQVPDGQDCYVRRVDRGDGTYVERQECRPRYHSEPIYDQRCDYRVDRWMPSRAAVAQGQDINPRWPETGVTGGRACLGCEREGTRSGEYELDLKAPSGNTYRCALPMAQWRAAEVHSRWHLAIGAVDQQPRCNSLTRIP